MAITPILTEKSLELARNGVYTFKLERKLNKFQIKHQVGELFSVHPVSVSTINYKPTTRRTNRGKAATTKGFKKAMVTLKKGETIALFMGEKKGAKK